MKKRRFKKSGSGGGLLFGALFSLSSLILSLAIFSFILSMLENPITFVGVSSLAALLVSGALSGFVIAKHKGEGGALTAFLSSIITSALIFATGLICSGGKIQLSVLMNILCYILISALFARLKGLGKKRKRLR